MNTDKINPNKKDAVAESGELTEGQLNSVSGGGKNTSKSGKLDTYLTITLENAMISGYSTSSGQ